MTADERVVPPARRALVTGANRGIGRHLALGLARAGLDVALLGRDEAGLNEAAAECAAPGVRTAVVLADVTDEAAVRAGVEQLETAWGGVDLVVNNAGRIEPVEADFLGVDLATTWEVVRTNVLGPMTVAHAFLPQLLAHGGGRLVTLNSGSGHKAMSTYTGYAVGKGAAARLTTQLDRQYRDRGVRVFDVSPGVVATDMTGSMPVHRDRTDWTPPEATVELVLGVARGELDALSGRFLRAGADTVASLRERRRQILDTDTRTLSLSTWGADDPVA